MKSNELKEVEFIKNLLRKGAERKTILQEFAKTYKGKSVKTFDNRLKVARKQMEGEIKQIEKRTEESITKEVEARKLKIMPIAERIDFLVNTITAQTEVSKVGNSFVEGIIERDGEGKIKKVISLVTFRDKLAALAELNKMDGSYAPTKQEIKINKLGKDLEDELYEDKK